MASIVSLPMSLILGRFHSVLFQTLSFYNCNLVTIIRLAINPSPLGGGLFISNKSEGGGGLFERGGLLNVAKTLVSVLHKEPECKVEKLKYKKLEREDRGAY